MKRYFLISVGLLGLMSLQATFVGEPSTKAELGKLLFSDPILSRDRTISCASCHKPQFAFADTGRVSFGVRHQRGTRNSPSIMNLSLQRIFFWDGKAASLEEQALGPIENPIEMNLSIEEALQRLKAHKGYRSYFLKVFGSEPDRTNLAQAISAFERTLETSNTAFDNWKVLDDPKAISDEAKKGFLLFNGKGKCVRCHFGADFTINDFRNIGLFDGKELNDSGRLTISHKPEDIGRFKVPGLRNVAITSPYMHNGQFKTLKEVLTFYNDPGRIVPHAINRDTVLAKPLGLTTAELESLEAFLNALTDKRFKATPSK